MYFKYKSLIIVCCFLTTLSKHFLIETGDNTRNSNSTDEGGDYDTFEDFVPFKPKVQGDI